MITMVAVAGLPILAVTLILASIAKLAGLDGDAGPGALGRLGPTVLMPGRWRRPATIFCAVYEGVLGAGLLCWDGPLPSWGAAMFFAVSTYVLLDLRRRRPDVGCGCFGDVSATPVGLRSIGRAIVLTAMAIAVSTQSMDVTTLRTVLYYAPWTVIPWVAGGIVLLLALSPEVDESVARLRYRAPCAQRELPVERSLSRLRSSAAWRSHVHLIIDAEPSDVWRELCWRFFAFPGRTADGVGVEVIFAVYLGGRHGPVRGAVVTAGGEPLTSLPESIVISAGR